MSSDFYLWPGFLGTRATFGPDLALVLILISSTLSRLAGSWPFTNTMIFIAGADFGSHYQCFSGPPAINNYVIVTG